MKVKIIKGAGWYKRLKGNVFLVERVDHQFTKIEDEFIEDQDERERLINEDRKLQISYYLLEDLNSKRGRVRVISGEDCEIVEMESEIEELIEEIKKK